MTNYYAVYAPDTPGTGEIRKATRAEHLARLGSLPATIKLWIGGPMTDEAGAAVGSMLVLSAPSLAEARAFMEADPYVREGVYAKVEVHPFTWSLGAPKV